MLCALVPFRDCLCVSLSPNSCDRDEGDKGEGKLEGKGEGRETYQHSIKYLKLSLHLIPLSGSSFSFGIGCLTIYVNKSISPARGCISVPSAGKGKRCCATSSS